jgi:hypothetical protein
MPDGLQTDGIEPVGQLETTEAEGGEQQDDFGGDGFPDLPETLQAQLVSLARKFCEEDRYSRRLEVQECRRARFYWRGMQHLYWDYKSEGWQVLGPAGGSINTSAKLEESSVLYTTNIYQAFGLTIQAVLTQNMPSVRFEPQDPEDAADIATAKAGERYKKIVEHNNDPIKLLTELSYFTWTDGRFHGWVRWAENKRTGANQETICILGALEVKVPITATDMDDYVYLQYSNESHVAMVKADVNEKFRDKIKGGAAGNGQDVYERTARISVKQGVSLLTQSGDTLSHLVTRQNTWLRFAAFEMLEKDSDDKKQLEELFPEGCRVRVDNGVYTGSWAESMDDCWSVCHPMPGDGQFRNAIGASMVSVQERFNDLVNITQDTYEYGLPAGYYDDELYDTDAFKRQRSKPNARYGVTKRPGETLAGSFVWEPAAVVSPDMLAFMKEMMGDLGQFLTGAFPALFGGNTGSNDTARGIATQRDQAMGRMGIVWRPIKKFWAKIIEQAIRLGAKMRQAEGGGDLSIAIPDEHGNVETTAVRIEELQGEIFCYPESDENFPESYTAKRANLMAILGSPMAASPMVQAMAAQPDNLQVIHDAIGIEELEIPGTDSRLKALTTIKILLESSPVPTPVPIPGPDGQPMMVPGPPGPSLQPDPDTDDLMIEGQEYKRWINSPEGQGAKQQNPPGFANVKLYFLAIKNLLQPPVPQVPVPEAMKAVAAAHAHGAAHGAIHGAAVGAQAAQGGGPPAAPPAPPQAPTP